MLNDEQKRRLHIFKTQLKGLKKSESKLELRLYTVQTSIQDISNQITDLKSLEDQEEKTC